MEKKTQKLLSKKPRTSTPTNLSKSTINSSHRQIHHQVDKDSFIRSLQLVTSDGSTDEEKKDLSMNIKGPSKKKDFILEEVRMATEDNLSVEEYYWKNPWKNTPVHLKGSKKSLKSKSAVSENKISNKMSTRSSPRKDISLNVFPASTEQKRRNILVDKHVMEAIEGVCKSNSHKSVGKTNKIKSVKCSSHRVKKTPKRFAGISDDVKSEFTDDSASDIDVVTVSNEGVTFSNIKSGFRKCSSPRKSESNSSSEKKRKTLYSFKEKFTEEMNEGPSLDMSSSISEKWLEIGNDLSKIGESIGLNVSTSKRKNKAKTKKSEGKGENITNSAEKLIEGQFIEGITPVSKSTSAKLLIGRSSSSGQKQKRKQLSEILPKPKKGKAKRKIIDTSEDERLFVDEENPSKISRNEKNITCDSELHDFSTDIMEFSDSEKGDGILINKLNRSDRFIKSNKKTGDTNGETDKRNVSTKSKRNKRKNYVEPDTDDDILLMEDLESDNIGFNNSSNSNMRENINDTSANDSIVPIRSLRNRRSNIGLSDYIQPKKRVYRKRITQKGRTSGGTEADGNSGSKKDEDAYKCSRCDACFNTLQYLKQHMMTSHNALWDKDCTEGLTDEKSLAFILKKIRKLHCPKCGKELKYMHYYRKHVEWCGREHEKFYCDLCDKYIMVMWEHEHSLMHVRKDKIIELDKENVCSMQESKNKTQDGRKRSAAKKAEKLLHAINKSYEGVVEVASDTQDPDAEIDSESSEEEVIYGDNYLDEEEREVIQEAKDSKRMYTGSHFANVFHKNMEHNKEMERYNSIQFPQFCPRVPDWDPLGESESDDYLPHTKVSPDFTIKINSKSKCNNSSTEPQQKLNLFEGFSFKDYGFLFTGGAVWGLAWCPYPYHVRRHTQYLAVSCQNDMGTLNKVTEAAEIPALIQIWNMGKLNQSVQTIPVPKLEFCIAHDYGVVRKVEWCPFRCWQAKIDSLEEDTMRQLGLLALACGDGSVRIFSIPDPECLKKDSENNKRPMVYRPSPVATLVGHKIRRGNISQCTTLSWCVKDSNYVLGGYGDGSLRIWNLGTTSPLLQVPTPDQGLLLMPFKSFLPHAKMVTDVNWSPHSTRHFITTSVDRTMKAWSIDNLVTAQFQAKSSAMTAADWPSIVKSVVYSEDDVYSQQKSHIRSQSYGDLTERNRGINSTVLGFPTTIWDVSVSDWHLMVTSCDNSGNVVCTYYPAHFGEKKPHRSKLHLYRLNLKPKTENQQNEETQQKTGELSQGSSVNMEDRNHGKNQITTTYRETVDKYYLEFKECSSLERRILHEDNAHLTQYPLSAIYRVDINPNLESCMFVVSGGEAGLVHIHNINRYISFHAARDLRQELRINS